MNDKITFPEDLADFLYWIKETTETYWRNVSPELKVHGAKWLPLTDDQIDELELKYSIKFDIEHRLFLKILHTIDKQFHEDEDEYEEDSELPADYEVTEEQKKIWEFWTPPYTPSLFYNWITEKEWIESRLLWIDDHFVGDMLSVNRSWLRSWGERPESDEEKIRIFRAWYDKAPRLLPITAHTYLMADGGYGLRPVMSVYGFDTIISAWSLRHYLIRQFGTELGLTEMHIDYDEEDEDDYPVEYSDLVRGIPELDALQTIRLDDAIIPYWKEVLTYYNHPSQKCWQGFWVPSSLPNKK